MKPKVKKSLPRVKFCWSCGKKLRASGANGQYVEVSTFGYLRTMHKQCARKLGEIE